MAAANRNQRPTAPLQDVASAAKLLNRVMTGSAHPSAEMAGSVETVSDFLRSLAPRKTAVAADRSRRRPVTATVELLTEHAERVIEASGPVPNLDDVNVLAELSDQDAIEAAGRISAWLLDPSVHPTLRAGIRALLRTVAGDIEPVAHPDWCRPDECVPDDTGRSPIHYGRIDTIADTVNGDLSAVEVAVARFDRDGEVGEAYVAVDQTRHDTLGLGVDATDRLIDALAQARAVVIADRQQSAVRGA